ncbi:outer membrane beta-barrel protein [candidate division KSB1 bacterium]|nr:outer membrane beta-barrel protein [candidate division KSB1 bacterium]
MKTKITILLLCFFAVTHLAQAQVHKFGLGGSLHSEPAFLSVGDDEFSLYYLGIFGSLTPLLRIPLKVSETVIIEPEIGFWHASDKYESKDSEYKYERKSSFNFYTLNLYLRLPRRYDSMILYPGLRLGVKYAEQKEKITGDGLYIEDEEDLEVDRNWVFGVLYGGEYFFNDHFSLGGEAQFNYSIVGREEDEYGKSSSSLMHTSANFIFRWYP